MESIFKPITVFINRLKKIGIKVEFIANYPWIYLDKVNGKKVKGKFQAEHGFTAFWLPVNTNIPLHISDIRAVFAKIRQTLEE